MMDNDIKGHAVYDSSESVYNGLQKAEHGSTLQALLEKWLRLLSITSSYRIRILLKADVKDWITILPQVADMLRDVGMMEHDTHWEAPYPELGAVRRAANLIVLNFERLKTASTQPDSDEEESGEDEDDGEDGFSGFGYDAVAAAAAAAAAAMVGGATAADAAAAGVAAAAKFRGGGKRKGKVPGKTGRKRRSQRRAELNRATKALEAGGDVGVLQRVEAQTEKMRLSLYSMVGAGQQASQGAVFFGSETSDKEGPPCLLDFFTPAEATRWSAVSREERDRAADLRRHRYASLKEGGGYAAWVSGDVPLVTEANVLRFLGLAQGRRRCTNLLSTGRARCNVVLPFDPTKPGRLAPQHLEGKLNRCVTCGALAGHLPSTIEFVESRVKATLKRVGQPIDIETARNTSAVKAPYKSTSVSVLINRVRPGMHFYDFVKDLCPGLAVLPNRFITVGVPQ